MIIVQLTGGMGNQMFQYALGRHLAQKHNTSLKLDLNFFKTYEWHEYSLNPFNIREEIATESEIMSLRGNSSNKLQQLIYKIKRKLSHNPYILENGMEYHPEILALPDNIYLEGYWQSEKYFSTISEEIKKEFTVRIRPSDANQLFLDKINSTNAVSLHIRRGNYAAIPEVTKTHGLSPLAYYYEAIEYIKSRVENPCFFVFSDEISWAKENLKIDGAHVFIDQNNANTDYEDIRMMSQCKHNIIANSTFSWWGAWLNPNREKIIIAPNKWFNDTSRSTKDIVPENWIKL